jgi:hypothetical protein
MSEPEVKKILASADGEHRARTTVVIREQNECFGKPAIQKGRLDVICIRLEDAPECDGTDCGERYRDGEEREPGPHQHLIVSGDKSKTSVELCTCVVITESLDGCGCGSDASWDGICEKTTTYRIKNGRVYPRRQSLGRILMTYSRCWWDSLSARPAGMTLELPDDGTESGRQ